MLLLLCLKSRVLGDYDERIYIFTWSVDIEENVRKAFSTKPISHRSKSFHVTMENVKKRLLQMTKAKRVQIMLGTGTLANDAIALQLRSLKGNGLVLTNGNLAID